MLFENIVNLTPHDVVFYRPSDVDCRHCLLPLAQVILRIEPRSDAEGRALPARVAVEWTYSGIENFHSESGLDIGIREYAPFYGAIENLPEPDGETIYIVSKMVADAAAASGRTLSDLRLVAQTVRDADGRIVGCLGLSRP